MIDLIQGDCFDYMSKMEDNTVDLIVTDPPYWHKKSPGKPYKHRNIYNTTSSYANSDLFRVDGYLLTQISDFDGTLVNKLMDEFKRLQDKMNCYIFCNDVLLAYYGMWAEQNKKHFSVLIWEKPLSIINKNRFSQHVEYIVRIYDYGTGLNKVEKDMSLYSKVKRYNQVRGKNKLHPTQKPVELIDELLKVSSSEEAIIFDPFMGSGTTGVSCKKLKRNFIGVELDTKFFETAEKRISKQRSNKKVGKSVEDLFE